MLNHLRRQFWYFSSQPPTFFFQSLQRWWIGVSRSRIAQLHSLFEKVEMRLNFDSERIHVVSSNLDHAAGILVAGHVGDFALAIFKVSISSI
jgi:hypothetical protein